MQSTQRIRELNDAFRRSFVGGRVLVTKGICERVDMAEIIERVRTFDDFNEDCDPFGEHDLVAFQVADGKRVYAKLDYYNLDMTGGSEDPACPEATQRVLTILLSEEY